MSAWKRHIIHLVAGIFLFPVLYQPVHILRHHGHEHSDHAHNQEHHLDCEHDHHHAPTTSDGTHISAAQEDCLVCEYEFVFKDLPGPTVLVNAPARYFEANIVPAISYVQTPSFSQVNPRAPPQT